MRSGKRRYSESCPQYNCFKTLSHVFAFIDNCFCKIMQSILQYFQKGLLLEDVYFPVCDFCNLCITSLTKILVKHLPLLYVCESVCVEKTL